MIVIFYSLGFAQETSIKLIDMSTKFPCKNDANIYYSYQIEGNDSLLIVAEGFADGIDYSIFKIISKDSLQLIFRFNPVLFDNSNKSKDYFWGYFWDISALNCTYENGQIKILSSVNHKIKRDGVIDVPSWQKILPVIFFNGKTTQPEITVGKIYSKAFMSIEEIIKYIK